MLGTKAGLEDLMHVKSWDDLKRWVAGHWGEVIDAVKRRLDGVKVGSGFDLTRALEELEGLKSRLDDDKVAREVVGPALLLIQAERLGVNKTTLRYFAAVASGAISGDGYVSVARIDVGLTSGRRTIALLWGTVLAAYGIKAEVGRARSAFQVIVSGGDAVKLARLYLSFGPPLLVGDDRFKNYKLAEAVRLGAGGALGVGWEGLKKTKGGRVAADLTISDSGVLKEGWPKYKVRLVKGGLEVRFGSTNRKSIEREWQRLKDMGLEEGKHFTVKMPKGNKKGYVYILREGLAHAAWLSVYGEGKQQRLAVEFIEHILWRAKEKGEKVYEKANKIIEEGKARGR